MRDILKPARLCVPIVLMMCTGCTFHTVDTENNSRRYFIFGFGTVKVTEQDSMSATRLLALGAVVKQNPNPMAAIGFMSENLVTMAESTVGEVTLDSESGRSFIRISSLTDSVCVNPSTEIEL